MENAIYVETYSHFYLNLDYWGNIIIRYVIKRREWL